MKTWAIAVAAAIMTAAPAAAALPVGAPAPDFRTQGAKGGKVFNLQLSQLLKRGPVVLYFFPAAFTSGCTIEARQFAEASEKFAAAGASLVGVAADPIDKLARFSVEECRSKFPVAVATPAMIAGYDARIPNTQMADRISYVIGRNGRIAFSYHNRRPEGHVEGTLGAVRALRR